MGADVSASRFPKRAGYSLDDVAEMVVELHSCLEEHRGEVSSKFEGVTKEVGQVRERVAKLEGISEGVAQRVGVVPNLPQQKAAWFPKPWQVIAGVCASAGGFIAIYKVLALVLPALNAAILAQH